MKEGTEAPFSTRNLVVGADPGSIPSRSMPDTNSVMH